MLEGVFFKATSHFFKWLSVECVSISIDYSHHSLNLHFQVYTTMPLLLSAFIHDCLFPFPSESTLFFKAVCYIKEITVTAFYVYP